MLNNSYILKVCLKLIIIRVSSLSELDSYLFCLSLSNRGFVSNYLYIFVKIVLIVGLRLRFCGLERTLANPLVFNNLDNVCIERVFI